MLGTTECLTLALSAWGPQDLPEGLARVMARGGILAERLPGAAVVALVLAGGLLAWWDPPKIDVIARESLEPLPEPLVEAMDWMRTRTAPEAAVLAADEYAPAVSVMAGAAFVLWERRAPFPLLDLSYLRVPRFTTPNVVAYCTYFSTFAIFFFTALYLGVIAGYSAYRIAGLFLPMTAMMIIASLLAGRWTTAASTRWLLVTGCLLFAAGLLLTNVVINPNPAYLPLAAALGLAGVGIGTCVVPVTSSVLGAVPAERSGMAASATNTSREFGAVTGIAILGAVVNAELRSGLVSRMTHLGASAALQQYVLQVIETGSVSLGHGGSTGNGPLDQIIQAGYAAFTSALHDALYLSAALLAGAALLSAVTLRQRRHAT